MIYVFVRRGQSLDTIAKDYGVSKQAIIAANKLAPPFKLNPGTALAIPFHGDKPPPQPKKTAAKPRPKTSEPESHKRPPPEVIPLD